MVKPELPTGLKFKVVRKEDSRLMKLIAFLLHPINPHFMSDYYTTIGSTVYAPHGVIPDEVLAHELVHVADWQRYNLAFALSYLLLLPVGITMRAFWEWRAYKISLHWWVYNDLGWTQTQGKAMLLNQFTSSAYAWMWPFKAHLEKQIDKHIEHLLKQT